MGVVHLAQQPGGDRVALKVLRPHIVGDDEARARLAREVNSLRRIRSPRVAEIVDADPWGAGARSWRPATCRGSPSTTSSWRRGRSRVATSRGSPSASPRRCWPCTPAACCTATSSRPTCSWRAARRSSSTSAWPGSPTTPSSPTPAGCSAPRATSPRRSSTARTPRPPPTSTRGRPPSPTPAWPGRRSAAGPSMAIMDRVRRGEHQLDGLPADIADRRRRGARPHAVPPPGPRADPGPAAQRGPSPGPRRRCRLAVDDPFTLPLAIASQLDAHQGTAPRRRRAPTRVETEPTDPRSRRQPTPAPVPLPERLRRGSLVLALGRGGDRRRRGVPLAGDRGAGAARLGAAQRLAGRHRRRRPPPGPRHPLVRRPAGARCRTLAPGPVDPRHRHARGAGPAGCRWPAVCSATPPGGPASAPA